HRLHVARVELQAAALRPERDPPEDDDLRAVDGIEDERVGLAPEHHGVELRGLVLEAEPEAAGARAPAARAPARDPDPAEPALDGALDARRQLGDRVDALRATEPELHARLRVALGDEGLEHLPALEQLERAIELRVGAELAFLHAFGGHVERFGI